MDLVKEKNQGGIAFLFLEDPMCSPGEGLPLVDGSCLS